MQLIFKNQLQTKNKEIQLLDRKGQNIFQAFCSGLCSHWVDFPQFLLGQKVMRNLFSGRGGQTATKRVISVKWQMVRSSVRLLLLSESSCPFYSIAIRCPAFTRKSSQVKFLKSATKLIDALRSYTTPSIYVPFLIYFGHEIANSRQSHIQLNLLYSVMLKMFHDSSKSLLIF